ncbi:MAG: hypothetical protein QM673_17510 [Gordonia sp. (in: high G+C Gram-positive bacteria)]
MPEVHTGVVETHRVAPDGPSDRAPTTREAPAQATLRRDRRERRDKAAQALAEFSNEIGFVD